MHQPRSHSIAHIHNVGIRRQQIVDHRAGLVAGTGVHDQTGVFVDDEYVFIGIHDVQLT